MIDLILVTRPRARAFISQSFALGPQPILPYQVNYLYMSCNNFTIFFFSNRLLYKLFADVTFSQLKKE